MSRLYNTFEFIGNISIPQDKEKFHKVNESDSGWEGHRINFAVQESKTNSTFVEMYGGYSKSKLNKVFTFSKGTENERGSRLEIPWEERLKPETIDMVADFRKIVIDFTTDQEIKKEVNELLYKIKNIEFKDEKTEEDKKQLLELKQKVKELAPNRYEFIHNYDAILLLADKLEEYKDYKFKVKGSIGYNEYNNQFYRQFNIESLEIVPNDTPSKLRTLVDIYFNKDSIDDRDFKETKKIFINGYVLSYDNRAKKDQFFPQTFIINASKLDFEDEKQVRLFNYLKNKFNVKGKGIYHLQWEVNVFRGADKVEVTLDDLTDQQREEIELGISKLEDFAPKGGVLGEPVYENRLVKPISKKIDDFNDFSEGAIKTEYTEDDLVFERVVIENTQIKPKVEEVKEESNIQVDLDKELDDLFG